MYFLIQLSIITNVANQGVIEEPQLYMLCCSSSSTADQLATIPDCVDCLLDLKQPVMSSEGIPVIDTPRFFIGDHSSSSV